MQFSFKTTPTEVPLQKPVSYDDQPTSDAICTTPPANSDFVSKHGQKPDGLRDKALQLIAHFGGEFLSEKRLSIVKGAEAYKFKCINGHIFYKYLTDLQKMRPIGKGRKLSKATAVSSSSASSRSSFDEDMM